MCQAFNIGKHSSASFARVESLDPDSRKFASYHSVQLPSCVRQAKSKGLSTAKDLATLDFLFSLRSSLSHCYRNSMAARFHDVNFKAFIVSLQ